MATAVAVALTAHALAAHLDAELNLDPNDLANAGQAAAASALSFTLAQFCRWRFSCPGRVAGSGHVNRCTAALAVTGTVGARVGKRPAPGGCAGGAQRSYRTRGDLGHR